MSTLFGIETLGYPTDRNNGVWNICDYVPTYHSLIFLPNDNDTDKIQNQNNCSSKKGFYALQTFSTGGLNTVHQFQQ